MKKTGSVYLVGAGPGDPKLQTLRCSELIRQADCIVYDSLANPSILAACQPSAELIYVGKRVGKHSHSQEEINSILIASAQKHQIVLRLKGGDPLVFGRGGEEIEALIQAGIDYEIVPGVTAGVAVPAYAGIPVTHRGVSRAVSFITGSSKEQELTAINWRALVELGNTLVFYMSTRRAVEISQALQEAGMPADMPMCIIADGTLATERIIRGRLADFKADYCDYESLSPGLIVIGHTVDFADRFAWRKPMPLAGLNIVVTRSLHQQSALAEGLEALGAKVILLPSIEIEALADQRPLHEAIESFGRAGSYSWIVFTSVNAVEIFFAELHKLGKDTRALASLRIGAVGKMSAEALRQYGVQADFVPSKFTGEDFAREFCSRYGNLSTERILIPGSELSRSTLAEILRGAATECHMISTYQNKTASYSPERIEALAQSPIDMICFCSSSAVDNFFALAQKYRIEDSIKGAKMASIGRLTSQTLRKHGYPPSIEAEESSIDGLIAAIVKEQEKA